MANTEFDSLRYELRGPVAHIILDRPPHNLIDRNSTLEYHAALQRADAEDSVHAIVLSGNGRGLSGGVDINFLESFGAEDMEAFLRLFYIDTLTIVRGLSKPIIAAVHGYAREGACTLAFACDMILAADTADFGYPGVPNLAGPPGMHTWYLQKLLGRMKAAELIFTGEPITAADAERLGLITRMVPAESLLDEAQALGEKLAQMSPLALQRTRELFYRMEDMPFNEVPAAAVQALAEAFDSEDSKEARRAYLEKRAPVWQSKWRGK